VAGAAGGARWYGGYGRRAEGLAAGRRERESCGKDGGFVAGGLALLGRADGAHAGAGELGVLALGRGGRRRCYMGSRLHDEMKGAQGAASCPRPASVRTARARAPPWQHACVCVTGTLGLVVSPNGRRSAAAPQRACRRPCARRRRRPPAAACPRCVASVVASGPESCRRVAVLRAPVFVRMAAALRCAALRCINRRPVQAALQLQRACMRSSTSHARQPAPRRLPLEPLLNIAACLQIARPA
jgi:hypothetical protein